MTMGPVEIERKIRQLDNDAQSIYTMLSAIQGTQERHTNRLGELAVKVDSLDGKVDGLDTRLTSLDSKVDGLDTRLTSLDSKVDGLDTGMTGVNSKFDTVLDLLRAGPAGQS
ncbi:MAG: hypothetical protein H0U36_10205 [Nocardioidaceae bacterium]|nr:hypothetical protein [Nocardioidaceae bacterium]